MTSDLPAIEIIASLDAFLEMRFGQCLVIGSGERTETLDLIDLRGRHSHVVGIICVVDSWTAQRINRITDGDKGFIRDHGRGGICRIGADTSAAAIAGYSGNCALAWSGLSA